MNSEAFAERWDRFAEGRVGLGCWALGGKHWGGQSETESRKVLQEAWEAGYRHFDTASSYGMSESLLGEFLRSVGEDYLVASKVYPGPRSTRIRETVRRSLDRLGVEKIDLFYLHWPRAGSLVEEDVEALAGCLEAGWIGAIGVSNYSPEELRRAHRVVPIAVYQGPYSLVWRSAEKAILPVCAELGIRFVSYGTLAEGLLAGNAEVPTSFPKGDHRQKSLLFHEANLARLSTFVENARKAFSSEWNLREVALQWALSQGGVSAVLAGARRVGQASANKRGEVLELDERIRNLLNNESWHLRPLWEGRMHYFGSH